MCGIIQNWLFSIGMQPAYLGANHNSLSSGSKGNNQNSGRNLSSLGHRSMEEISIQAQDENGCCIWNGMTGLVPIRSYCLHPFRSQHQVR